MTEDFRSLENRIRMVLPEQYQDCYEDVQPVSMGSAALKFGKDGKVAWGEIWSTFCDLAMAGGPPHKGKLLEPASPADIAAKPEAYRQVADEICRGIALAAGLEAIPSPESGWIRIDCGSHGMAGWLTRAIVMENISARCRGPLLELPAGPDYRVEKEIKNVITSVAKTCHYWEEHMDGRQRREIGNLFARLNVTGPLIQPDFRGAANGLADRIAAAVHEATGLQSAERRCSGWLGLDCGTIQAAIWMMRALVVNNVLARREDATLFVAVDSSLDPTGDRVAQAVIRVHGFSKL